MHIDVFHNHKNCEQMTDMYSYGVLQKGGVCGMERVRQKSVLCRKISMYYDKAISQYITSKDEGKQGSIVRKAFHVHFNGLSGLIIWRNVGRLSYYIRLRF